MHIARLFLAIALGVVGITGHVSNQCRLRPGDDTCPEGCAGAVSLVVYLVDGSSTSTITTIASTVTLTTTATVLETTTRTTDTNTETSAPETTILSCPGDHKEEFIGQSGSTFLIDCFSGIAGVELNARREDAHSLAVRSIGTADTFNNYIQLCDDRAECEAVGYTPESGTCRGFSDVTSTSDFANEWIANIVERVNSPSSTISTTTDATPTSTASTTGLTSSGISTSKASTSDTSKSNTSASGTSSSRNSNSETSRSSSITGTTSSSLTVSTDIMTSTTASPTSSTETASATDLSPTTSISSTSSAQPTSTGLSCPDSDEEIFIAESGASFRIDCENGITGSEIDGDVGRIAARSLGFVSDFESCIQICDAAGPIEICDNKVAKCELMPGCEGVSYSPATGECRGFKNPSSTDPNGDWVARRIDTPTTSSSMSSSATANSSTSSPSPSPTDVSCPGSDNENFVANSGTSFRIKCNVGISGDEIGVVEAVRSISGRSIGVTSDFGSCIQICDDNGPTQQCTLGNECFIVPGCQAVSYNPETGNCRGFSSPSETTNPNGDWVAIRLDEPSSTSSTVSSIASVTSSTSGTSTTGATKPSGLRCPRDDQFVYSADERLFKIRCDIGIGSPALETRDFDSFEDCMVECAHYSFCVAVDFDIEAGICYGYTSGFTTTTPNGKWVAIDEQYVIPSTSSSLSMAATSSTSGVSPGSTLLRCPEEDKSSVVVSGRTYIIRCDVTINSDSIAVTSEATFADCVGVCGRSEACQSLWYQPDDGGCFLHGPGYTTGPASPYVWAAIEQVSSSVSSTTSSSTSNVIPEPTAYMCPDDDQSVVKRSDKFFRIRCDISIDGDTRLFLSTAPTLDHCLDFCGGQVDCLAVNFSADDSECESYGEGFTTGAPNGRWAAIRESAPISSTPPGPTPLLATDTDTATDIGTIIDSRIAGTTASAISTSTSIVDP